jgi:hypothetical protein
MARKKRRGQSVSAPWWLTVDVGNALLKAVCGGNRTFFPHALAEIGKARWESALNRFGNVAAHDFVSLDGKYYVVGATAENFDLTKRTGRPKYTREYYGPLFAAATARIFATQPDMLSSNMKVMASHTPADAQWAGDLGDMLRTRWKFTVGDDEFDFKVDETLTFDEPFGGYCNKAFEFGDGGHIVAPLYGEKVVIIDIGGGTNSILAVNEDGDVEYAQAGSGTLGINDVMEALETELNESYHEVMRDARSIPTGMLRKTLDTGIFRPRGKQFDVEELVQVALTGLVNEVQNLYLTRGRGGIDAHRIILTGGGSAILFDRLLPLLDHENVELAGAANDIHFANVKGADKFRQVIEYSELS